MRYVFLIYSDGKNCEHSPEAMAPWAKFNQEVAKKGWIGEALQETTTATTVKVRGGGTMTTDGPFAETKEHLGGFYLMDCKDLDEALDIAAKIPAAEFGSIEVRPVMELNLKELVCNE